MVQKQLVRAGLLLCAAVGLVAAPREFYVSTKGNDSWAGTLRRPFRTLEHARDAARSAKAEGATVLVRGGDYLLAGSFRLTEADSGTEARPVVYRNYGHEVVRLVGGRALRQWKPVRDKQVLNRFPVEARKHIVACDLRGSGIVDYGEMHSRGFGRPTEASHVELFFQGRRMTVARWPNEGFTEIVAPGDDAAPRDEHGGILGRKEFGLIYAGDRPRNWKPSTDIWVHGYWAWDWANSYERVASIDLDKRQVRTAPPYAVYGFRKGQPFFFLNILEELDRPGEYYLDRSTGVLYFWPPAPIQSGETAVSLVSDTLIDLREASYVTLRGFTIEYGRGRGIEIHGGTGVKVLGCTIRNVGNQGVVVQDGTQHTVAGCDIYQTGDGGIQLHGGDRKTLAPASHSAVNNHIHHLAEWSRTYQPGVLLTGVGHRVLHNLIHDGPHNGIQISGNDHLIEFNELHHLCLETGDVGAFYIGRDYSERGNRVRHNFFHHLGGRGSIGSMAVYLDDCASGVEVFGNIFYRTTRSAFIGGGRDNSIENNIFVDCTPAVDIDGRGLESKPVWHDMVYQTMKEHLEAMNYLAPPYSTRYPKILSLEKAYQVATGVPPEGNRVVRNIIKGANAANGKWLRLGWRAKRELIEIRDNLAGEDPLFVDESKMDFRLKPASPAWKLGFQPIPMEKIGLQVDDIRTTLPK
jgi:Right handed beta helix region